MVHYRLLLECCLFLSIVRAFKSLLNTEENISYSTLDDGRQKDRIDKFAVTALHSLDKLFNPFLIRLEAGVILRIRFDIFD
jgi:hypothetical protein